jgi:endoglucanase
MARTNRVTNLRSAVAALTASGSIAVYLDGGHSNWQSVTTMADRLRSVGVSKVRGFATNVANYNRTSAEAGYGTELATALGTHYIVDTSRNGAGPSTGWCNPAGQALGARPTSSTAVTAADAWFWVKRPGESDGVCNGGPAAGSWFEAYALGLASRAGW